MSFQSVVNFGQASGVPGEKAYDGPTRTFPWTLVSNPEPNVVGSTAYTVTTEGVAQAGSGGTLGFAGILVDPKSYVLYGTGAAGIGQALAPTLTLPDDSIGQLSTMGIYFVILTTAAAIDDPVIYNNTTGALASYTAGGSVPSGYTAIPNARVILRASAANALAIIQLTG